MKRTTVYLEESTDLELSQLAKQQDRAKAELIREALESYLGAERKPRPLPRSVGMGRSGVPDLAEHDEELLLEMLEQEHQETLASYEAQPH